MSKRRTIGEWVWLAPGAGMVGESARLRAEIAEYFDPPPCIVSSCNDPLCVEWPTLWTAPDPLSQNRRHTLCHVSECQMFDKQQER